MKEHIVYPEILEKLTKKIIARQLAACETLQNNYQQKIHNKEAVHSVLLQFLVMNVLGIILLVFQYVKEVHAVTILNLI